MLTSCSIGRVIDDIPLGGIRPATPCNRQTRNQIREAKTKMKHSDASSNPAGATKTDDVKPMAIDEETKKINELAKNATPRQIRAWIDRLEALYNEKKNRVRNDLQDKVTDLMSSNGYTIEELFGARVLPSAADLAEQTRSKEDEAKKDKERLMDSVCRT